MSPMGLCNAPSTFQCLMNSVYDSWLDVFVLVYLDDILVFSDSAEQHLLDVERVLQRLREHKLQVKRSKCEFFKTHVDYLGHIVGNEELRVDAG